MKNEKIILIEHVVPEDGQIIQESSTDGKDLYVNGIFMQADVVNRNKRRYNIQEMAQVVENSQKQIKNRQMFGSLDHPESGANSLSVMLATASHMITEMTMKGNSVYGKAKLLSTPMGNIARAIIEDGGVLGISSRGVGNVDPNTGDVSGFQLITLDLVATPSCPDAVLSSLRESLDIVKNGKTITTLAEASQHDPRAQEYLKKEILEFFKSGLIKVKK